MLCKERKVEQSAVSVWRTAPKNASKMKFLIVVALLKLCESETGRMGYTARLTSRAILMTRSAFYFSMMGGREGGSTHA